MPNLLAIPVAIPLHSATFCVQCECITESKGRCEYCQSSAIMPLAAWLDRVSSTSKDGA